MPSKAQVEQLKADVVVRPIADKYQVVTSRGLTGSPEVGEQLDQTTLDALKETMRVYVIGSSP